jgi:hypothetical protein
MILSEALFLLLSAGEKLFEALGHMVGEAGRRVPCKSATRNVVSPQHNPAFFTDEANPALNDDMQMSTLRGC